MELFFTPRADLEQVLVTSDRHKILQWDLRTGSVVRVIAGKDDLKAVKYVVCD